MSPLDVMLFAMKWSLTAGKLTAASGFASDAAPYIHPKLSSMDANVKGNLTVIAKTGVPRVGRD